MENKFISPQQSIKGWGIDADPQNNPTYPIKKRTGDDHLGYTWERPPQQPAKTEILHSNERPNLSAVFGSSLPPSGVSGMIRRYAFRYSESSFAHWLPLILADRINVLEGIMDDFKRGHIPNIFAERGCKAMWKHDRKNLIKKVASTGIVAVLILSVLLKKKGKR